MSALTQTRIEMLKERMLTRRGELVTEIKEKLAESREHSSLTTLEQRLEGGDSALSDLIASTDMAMVRRDVEEMREIDAAIGRIESGEKLSMPDRDTMVRVAAESAQPMQGEKKSADQ